MGVSIMIKTRHCNIQLTGLDFSNKDLGYTTPTDNLLKIINKLTAEARAISAESRHG